MRRFQKTLENECLLANIGFDAAENEPRKGLYRGIIRYFDFDWIHYSEPSRREIHIVRLQGRGSLQTQAAERYQVDE